MVYRLVGAHLKAAFGRPAVPAVVLAFALCLSGAAVALASSVDPVLKAGNLTCGSVDSNLVEIKKIEPVANGTFTGSDGTSITIAVSGSTFDWSASNLISAVVVKGGPDANLYDYRPGGATSDTGLHSPTNPSNGRFYGLSHVSFCKDLRPASIGGHKWQDDGCDLNRSLAGNKIEDMTYSGQPCEGRINGTVIYLFNASGAFLQKTETAGFQNGSPAGEYLFTGLTAGTYIVCEYPTAVPRHETYPVMTSTGNDNDEPTSCTGLTNPDGVTVNPVGWLVRVGANEADLNNHFGNDH